VWSLLAADSAYHERDSVDIEGIGRDFVFPHVLPSDSLQAASLIRVTPFMDEVTLDFALHGLTSLGLGTGPQTDLLAISLSATDVIGHRFGPDSREIHDQVLRVDRMLGTFIDSLYKLRDSSRVTIVLTSDHGIGTIPELATKSTPAPTRVDPSDVLTQLRASLVKAKLDSEAIVLDPPVVLADRAAFRAAHLDADSALAAFAAMLRTEMGVERVDVFRKLLRDTLSDPIARRWAHQFPATSNVELVITLTPLSTWGGNVASSVTESSSSSRIVTTIT
jgi:hypothetical protein